MAKIREIDIETMRVTYERTCREYLDDHDQLNPRDIRELMVEQYPWLSSLTTPRQPSDPEFEIYARIRAVMQEVEQEAREEARQRRTAAAMERVDEAAAEWIEQEEKKPVNLIRSWILKNDHLPSPACITHFMGNADERAVRNAIAQMRHEGFDLELVGRRGGYTVTRRPNSPERSRLVELANSADPETIIRALAALEQNTT